MCRFRGFSCENYFEHSEQICGFSYDKMCRLLALKNDLEHSEKYEVSLQCELLCGVSDCRNEKKTWNNLNTCNVSLHCACNYVFLACQTFQMSFHIERPCISFRLCE